MRQDDEPKHFLLRRAGLGFAYMCFAVAILSLGAAIYILPLDGKVRIFLGVAGAFVVTLFVFMAVLTHRTLKLPESGKERPTRPPDGEI